MMDPKRSKAKALIILQEHDDLIKFIIEEETKRLGSIPTDGDAFEIAKKAILNEGIKEGLRRFSQKLNTLAGQDV